MNLHQKTAIEIAAGVAQGQWSAREAVQACAQASSQQSGLNALSYVATEEALEAADRIDQAQQSGQPLGPLSGVPFAAKDAICTLGLPTTAGSKILHAASAQGPWRPPYSATVIERLEAAGAIVFGKANMDEFAMGSSNETSCYGPVKNPSDPGRVPGGSSGGSAAAVAAQMVPFALGSDTGGSIRQPAALCGVVGVKPTYGRVSRYGLIAFASSLDQVGPLTPDVRSSARIQQVISGWDPKDSTTTRAGVGGYEAACEQPLAPLRFGLPEQYFAEGLEAPIRARIELLVERLRSLGCEVVPVSLPHTHYGVATYYVLATAEASSNLSRFDGVRFGFRKETPGADLEKLYAQSRSLGFGPEVQRRILLGTYVLSAGYYDAYYDKAQRVRTLIRRDFDAAFSQVDALITPTSPCLAFKIGERMTDPLSMYMADVYTVPASLAGISALSVPVGTTENPTPGGNDLPVGAQILCPALGEETLFRAAAGIEALMADVS